MPGIFQSIRFRLIALVLVTSLPALGVLTYQGIQGGQELRDQYENRVRLLADRFAVDLRMLLDSAEDMLGTVAAAPVLRRHAGSGCSDFLSQLAAANERYSTFFVVDDRGMMVCAPTGSPQNVRFDDRGYFQEAINTKHFAVGNVIKGRITGETVLPFAYPTIGPAGTVELVLISALKLKWLEEHFEAVPILDEATISLLDHNGQTLVRRPEGQNWRGKRFPHPGILQSIKGAGDGSVASSGVDGSERFFGFVSIGDPPFAHVVAEVPTARTIAPFYRGLRKAIGLLLVLTAGVVAVAWGGGGRLFIRPIQRLKATADAMRKGHLAVRAGPLDGAGDLAALGMAFDDMAEVIQRREETLQHQKSELQRVNAELEHKDSILRQAQKMEIIGQLAGGFAHDFNNLLTVILGNIQLLQRRVKDDEKSAKLAGTATNAALRGAQLTKQLLAFSRRQVLNPERVDINKLIVEIDEMLGNTLGANVKVRMTLSKSIWPARIDEGQLETALLNLVVNARDAMPDGGTVTIETANVTLAEADPAGAPDMTPGAYVMVAVKDTGTGMPPEVIKKAFDPFFTTKERGKGTGLGLSMVYGFVRQSDGFVQVDSMPGSGTSIALFFPKDDSRSRAQRKRTSAPIEQGASGKGEKILVVEDEADVRDLANSMLEELGYRVLTAPNGFEALQILGRDTDIDLIFTDVVMPGGMNGVELAATALRQRPDLKVLYTSGYTSRGLVNPSILANGSKFIEKPYLREPLGQKIRELLDAEEAVS